MATTTTKLGLRKPDPNPSTGDFINVTTDISDSMDKLDDATGVKICTSGTRPTGSQRWDGRDIFETDTRRRYMWSASVNDWLPILQSRAAGGPTLLNGSTDSSGEGLNIQASGAAVDILRSRVTGDSNTRFLATAAGGLSWGPGNAAADTNLYRSNTNELRTDDSLVVFGNLFVGSNLSGVPLKIYENVLGGTTASVGPISVPTSGFGTLMLEITGRSNVAATTTNLRIRFNSDSSSIYHSQSDFGQTSTSGANEVLNDSSIQLAELTGASAPANMPGSISIRIPWYRGTTFYKTLHYLSASNLSAVAGGMVCRNGSAVWRSTSAITSVTFLPVSGSFIAGTSIAIYALP